MVKRSDGAGNVMSERWNNTRRTMCVIGLVFAVADHGAAQETSPRAAASQYFSRGADVTSVPPAGQPGADYFHHGAQINGAQTNGADVTSVPRAGQPGAELFSRGADVTSVPRTGQPGADYFRNGAQPNGADVTSVPRAGQPGADIFSRGADVTSVPRPGQPGADLFTRGADVTNVRRTDEPIDVATPPIATTDDEEPTPEEADEESDSAEAEAVEADETETEAEVEAEPSDERATDALPSAIEWLFAPWPTVVEDAQPDDTRGDDALGNDADDEQDQGSVSGANSDDLDQPPPAHDNAAAPSAFDRARSAVNRIVFGMRIVTLTLAALLALACVATWRALKSSRRS